MPIQGQAGTWAHPDSHKVSPSLLSVQGKGLAPNQIVTLSTGPKQSLTATADGDGTVVFKNLKYSPESELSFDISFAVQGAQYAPVQNSMALDLNPYTGSVKVKGNATRAASIVINLSSEDSKSMIANQDGVFGGQAYAQKGLSGRNLKIIASVINVEETCCPRNLKPFTPATFVIQSTPVAPVPAKKADAGIIEGTITASLEKNIGGGYALSSANSPVTVPANLMNTTWVEAFQKFGNQIVETLMGETAAWGSFMEAQNTVNSILSLQEHQAKTAIKYLPSEQLCRFGSLSQSLVASEAVTNSNKEILSRTLQGRETGAKNTLFARNNANMVQGRANQLVSWFCDKTDFRKICKNQDNDTNVNKDVDYTRNIDIPLTLNIDFTNDMGVNDEPEEATILALADNLFPAQPIDKTFNSRGYYAEGADYRSLQSIRSVARNSLVSLITEKAKGLAGSAPYMGKLMQALGVPEDQVDTMLGKNPSYYAQMEVLTKKLYQDPAFFVNLIDTPANVDRQRAAIRAIKLQQGEDFAETVKRREMLLSLLLELKLRERAESINQRIVNAGE